MIDQRDTAVFFQCVTKTYQLFETDKQRFKSCFSNNVPYKTKIAVRNVSFAIKKGESVAFLGQNGAGKSTILKLISGVAHPTSGVIRVKGRVSALLELSAGFDSNLTGRENIFYRGEILGISKREIAQHLNDIIAFAELGEYIDQPVRRYSSGMRARLGFSINTFVNPDIVIVDEALSVGDKYFREKCRNKVQEIIDNGATFLFVTHSIQEAKKFCKRGIVMNEGCVVYDGSMRAAANVYDQLMKP